MLAPEGSGLPKETLRPTNAPRLLADNTVLFEFCRKLPVRVVLPPWQSVVAVGVWERVIHGSTSTVPLPATVPLGVVLIAHQLFSAVIVPLVST